MRRQASATVLALVVLLFLTALLNVLITRSEALREETEDLILHSKVQTVAIDLLEQVTDWVLENKPAGPDGSYDNVALSKGATVSQLEVSLPSSLAQTSSDGIETTAQLHWCIFTPPSTISSSTAEEFPPALTQELNDCVFRQTYLQSGAGLSLQTERSRAAWRISVLAWPSDEDADGFRCVAVERVIVLEQ